jgi:site-specific DNA-methyltransferase (adenine-specific)
MNWKMKSYFGNALSGMDKLIKREIKVDAIITDPPFEVTACKWDKIIPFEDMWNRLKKLRKENSPILLFGTEPFSSALRLSNLKEFKYDWIWKKNMGTNFLMAKRMPIRHTENIHVFFEKASWYYPQITSGHPPTHAAKGRNTGNVYSGKMKLEYKGGKTTRFPKNILEFKTVNNYKRIHPSEKPVELMEYFVKTYTKEGDTILDFTCGSGSTAKAALKLGRRIICIDNGYCENKKSKYFGKSWIEVTKDRVKDYL